MMEVEKRVAAIVVVYMILMLSGHEKIQTTNYNRLHSISTGFVEYYSFLKQCCSRVLLSTS
jgi:hypothetical protein